MRLPLEQLLFLFLHYIYAITFKGGSFGLHIPLPGDFPLLVASQEFFFGDAFHGVRRGIFDSLKIAPFDNRFGF